MEAMTPQPIPRLPKHWWYVLLAILSFAVAGIAWEYRIPKETTIQRYTND